MGSPAYLRFLARVVARQPRLRPPPDAALALANSSELPGLMPYTYPISGHRGRSFEHRCLELWAVDFPPRRPNPPTFQTHHAATLQPDPSLGPAATSPGQHPPASGTAAPIVHPGGSSGGKGTVEPWSRPLTAASPPPPQQSASGLYPAQHDSHSQDPCHPHPQLHSQQPHTLHPESRAQQQYSRLHRQGDTQSHVRTSPQQEPQQQQQQGHSVPHSYMEVRYPFSSHPRLWRQYYRPGFPGLDPAIILEDFDTFAADVAARHVGHVPDSMLVTAFLERMTWHLHAQPSTNEPNRPGNEQDSRNDSQRQLQHPHQHGQERHSVGGGVALPWRGVELWPRDLRMSGQVTWVGRSSMEVLVQLTAEGPPISGPTPSSPAAASAPSSSCPQPANQLPSGQLAPGQLLATAEFVMALRDTSLRRAVDVPPLHPRDPLERELFRRGREHQRERQARREQQHPHPHHPQQRQPNHHPHLQQQKQQHQADLPSRCSPLCSPAGAGVTTAAGAAVGDQVGLATVAAPAALADGWAGAAAAAGLEPGQEHEQRHHQQRQQQQQLAPQPPPDEGQELLARALADGLRGSEHSRTVPTDAAALQLLILDPVGETPAAAGPSSRGTQKRVEAVAVAALAAAEGSPGRKRGRGEGHRADSAEGRQQPKPGKGQRIRPRGLGEQQQHGPADPPTHTSSAAAVVPVRQTELHRTVVAEHSDRNTSGTVFGGHLLRLGYEQAAAAAAAFAGGPCELLWLEEGAISSPARVGDILHAVSRVVWSDPAGRTLRVAVRLGKYDIASPGHHTLALTLAVAFLAPASAAPPGAPAAVTALEVETSGSEYGVGDGARVVAGPPRPLLLRQVVPGTLAEAAEAMAAQRRHGAVVVALSQAEMGDSAG